MEPAQGWNRKNYTSIEFMTIEKIWRKSQILSKDIWKLHYVILFFSHNPSNLFMVDWLFLHRIYHWLVVRSLFVCSENDKWANQHMIDRRADVLKSQILAEPPALLLTSHYSLLVSWCAGAGCLLLSRKMKSVFHFNLNQNLFRYYQPNKTQRSDLCTG